jgi:hypothetical protein
LLGYGLFGVGYIGYMTFVVAVLREQGASAANVTFFYAALGLAVVASSRIWAGLLNHFKGGQALAILNAMLSVATVIPALTSAWPAMLLSGVLFGGVFLSVVASTTAMVKHNLPASQWATGISAFTVVFATLTPEIAGTTPALAEGVEFHYYRGITTSFAKSGKEFVLSVAIAGAAGKSAAVSVTGAKKVTTKLNSALQVLPVKVSAGAKTVSVVIDGKTYTSKVTVK